MVGNNSNLEIFNRIKETNSNNADEYSNSKTYVKDEYCIYNNTLYKANQAINTAEEFTESHWTETTVGTELKSQADSISSLNSRIFVDYNAYMATVSFSMTSKTYTPNTWSTIAVIPENLRPASVLTFTALSNDAMTDETNTLVWARVTTDGDLQVYIFWDRASVAPAGVISYAI